jgi:hypothetical protein
MNEILIGVLYLVSLAFIITFLFAFLLNNRGPWGSFWTFFVIILLAVFATDAWIGPVGPYFFDEIYWVPPLAVGLLIALLLAATTPSPKTRSKIEIEQKELLQTKKTSVALGTFFWFLFVILLLVVVLGTFYKYY